MADGEQRPLTRKQAWDLVGGLGRPSKMPGYAYGLPAKECLVGSKLRPVPGSVCNKCYAMKGHYTMPNVEDAQYRRLESIKHPRWVEAMTQLISTIDMRYFRWHDAGDIQSPTHLEKIAAIAVACPHVRFWLPTREKVFVYTYLKKHGAFPKNLVVRLSATMVDGPPPTGFPNTSTVSRGEPFSPKVTCPAPEQNNECGACRRCWNPRVKNVCYAKH